MKKITFFLLTFLVFAQSFSQDNVNSTNTDSQNFNELKLNGLFLIAGAIEVSYEKTLNEESGVGVSIFLPFDDEVKDDINYYLSPYYRFYFGTKYASGFFLEGFGMLNSVNEYYFSSNNNDIITEKNSITDFALGIGLGGKWVTNSGFIGELNLGFGRNLFGDYNDESLEFVGKAGITLGYRF
ncbi:DUF3575 domain-containing protein [Snuella sedimenti]|uniref:DUF3575 domain-containing protein n=1 Tax=Snuella sedimenti TaxID=2798802 RepID=A0A8J7JDK2_9FLAO|nr:DUF3575 domain-containing protein [Snuella sedimenti]MBJ6369109.1 DUF3575 domain-containing protein [Snuella sedimenti]